MIRRSFWVFGAVALRNLLWPLIVKLCLISVVSSLQQKIKLKNKFIIEFSHSLNLNSCSVLTVSICDIVVFAWDLFIIKGDFCWWFAIRCWIWYSVSLIINARYSTWSWRYGRLRADGDFMSICLSFFGTRIILTSTRNWHWKKNRETNEFK